MELIDLEEGVLLAHVLTSAHRNTAQRSAERL